MIKFFLSQLSDPWLLARYIVSGLTAAAIQLGSLALLVEKGILSHTAAVPVAFVLSAIVAFILQKFWTFGHRTIEGMHFQIGLYMVLLAVALLLNVILMYVFVDLAHMWYVLAQIVTIALVTIVTFLSNKYFVFKGAKDTSAPQP